MQYNEPVCIRSCVVMIASMVQKNLPRKKRRKLEAAREMLEEEGHDEKPEVCTPRILYLDCHYN